MLKELSPRLYPVDCCAVEMASIAGLLISFCADFVGDVTKPEPALKAIASPTSSDADATRSVAKPDLLSQLQMEVMQLKQELERIKSSHNVKVQELVHEINEERRAQKVLLEDVEKLKKIVFERFGKL